MGRTLLLCVFLLVLLPARVPVAWAGRDRCAREGSVCAVGGPLSHRGAPRAP